MTNNKIPKIAHVIISMSVGGAEQLALKMMRAKKDHVICFCLDSEGPLAIELKKIGIEVIVFNRKPGWDFSVAYKIAKASKKYEVDILHCHQYSPWFYGILSKILNPQIKVIYTEHGRPYPDKPKAIRRVFNLIMSHITNSVTVVSPFIGDSLVKIEWFPKKLITIIYNGIEKPYCQDDKIKLRQKLKLSNEMIYIILPARFNPIKWHLGLIKAFSEVVKNCDKARLILIGDGQEKNNILKTIEKLEISNYVIMPGVQNNVVEWLNASDIFVLSSLSEGTSVSLLESMGVGLPSVVTDAGGNKYVVEKDVTSFLCEKQNCDDITKFLVKLCKNRKLRIEMGLAAKERFGKLFLIDNMLSSFEKLYCKVANTNEK